MAYNIQPDDAQLSASINDFQAALPAERALLVPAVMPVIIDDSNQSAMAFGQAPELAGLTHAVLHMGASADHCS